MRRDSSSTSRSIVAVVVSFLEKESHGQPLSISISRQMKCHRLGQKQWLVWLVGGSVGGGGRGWVGV